MSEIEKSDLPNPYREISPEMAKQKIESGRYRKVGNLEGGNEQIREKTSYFALRVFGATLAGIATLGLIAVSEKGRKLFERKVFIIKPPQIDNNTSKEAVETIDEQKKLLLAVKKTAREMGDTKIPDGRSPPISSRASPPVQSGPPPIPESAPPPIPAPNEIEAKKISIAKKEADMAQELLEIKTTEQSYNREVGFSLNEISTWSQDKDPQVKAFAENFTKLAESNKAVLKGINECFHSAPGQQIEQCDTKKLAEFYQSSVFKNYVDNISTASCLIEQAKAMFAEKKPNRNMKASFDISITSIPVRLTRHAMLSEGVLSKLKNIDQAKSEIAQIEGKANAKDPRFESIEVIKTTSVKGALQANETIAKYQINELKSAVKHLTQSKTSITIQQGKMKFNTASSINSTKESPQNNIKTGKILFEYMRSFSTEIMKMEGTEQGSAKAELKEMVKILSKNTWYKEVVADTQNSSLVHDKNFMNRCLEDVDKVLMGKLS